MGEKELGREVTPDSEACPKSPKSKKEKSTRPLLSYLPKWNRTQLIAITLTTLTLASVFSLGRFFLLMVPFQGDTVIWNYTYGGSGNEVAGSLLQLDDGGFAFCGSTSSWGLGGHWNITGGGHDMWLVRLDEQANILWNRTYGTTLDDGGSLVLECQEGGFAFLGSTFVNRSGVYDRACLLVRLDENGNQIWNKTLDYSEIHFSTMVECNEGGFALAGFLGSVFAESGDFWLIRMDSEGNLSWNNTYSGYAGYQQASIVETESGFLIFSRANRGASSIHIENHNVYLLCTDTSGSLLWSRTYDSGNHDYGVSIFPEDAGGCTLICLTGHTQRAANLWIIRACKCGEILWEHIIGPIIGNAYDIIRCYDGGYALVGSCSPTQWWQHINLYLARTDTMGNVLWQREYGFEEVGDYGVSIIQLADGSFLIAGMTHIAPNVETSEAWLLRVTDMPISYYEMTHFMFYGVIVVIITFIIIGVLIIAQRRRLRT